MEPDYSRKKFSLVPIPLEEVDQTAPTFLSYTNKLLFEVHRHNSSKSPQPLVKQIVESLLLRNYILNKQKMVDERFEEGQRNFILESYATAHYIFTASAATKRRSGFPSRKIVLGYAFVEKEVNGDFHITWLNALNFVSADEYGKEVPLPVGIGLRVMFETVKFLYTRRFLNGKSLFLEAATTNLVYYYYYNFNFVLRQPEEQKEMENRIALCNGNRDCIFEKLKNYLAPYLEDLDAIVKEIGDYTEENKDAINEAVTHFLADKPNLLSAYDYHEHLIHMIMNKTVIPKLRAIDAKSINRTAYAEEMFKTHTIRMPSGKIFEECVQFVMDQIAKLGEKYLKNYNDEPEPERWLPLPPDYIDVDLLDEEVFSPSSSSSQVVKREKEEEEPSFVDPPSPPTLDARYQRAEKDFHKYHDEYVREGLPSNMKEEHDRLHEIYKRLKLKVRGGAGAQKKRESYDIDLLSDDDEPEEDIVAEIMRIDEQEEELARKTVEAIKDTIRRYRERMSTLRYDDPSARMYAMSLDEKSRSLEKAEDELAKIRERNNSSYLVKRQRIIESRLEQRQQCVVCDVRPIRARCGAPGCGAALYCGQRCADAHWEVHKCEGK
jgi:hypothetical protein